MSEPTKVTKVLINKIHGGRKQDSKFWKSEFSDAPPPRSKKNQPNISKLVMYPLVVVALFIVGYASYNIYGRYFFTNDIAANKKLFKPRAPASATIALPEPEYYIPKSPKVNKKSYTKKPKDRPVTKKELDRAIDKALRQRSTTTNRSVQKTSGLPYYRVELTSGSVIKAKSAIKDGTHYTIKDTQGLEFSMQRSDIQSVKKIFPE